ncbi:hypothetical protein ABZ490_05575 [Streptomyces sp. NPDC005811]|uniref:hypothetical protein n=1 Tax=Streptomyces sp. NPDC005811 TaxID=3154565 RepID=UPI0034060BA4
MSDDREPPETALEAVLREIEDAEARADEFDHLEDHPEDHAENHPEALTTSEMRKFHWDE